MLHIVLGTLNLISLYLVYKYMKMKYQDVKLNEVNSLLSEILETNFKNNSLSNAAQSILIILKRFYNMDYVTILLNNEKSGHMRVIASNAGKDVIPKLEEYCNDSIKDMGTFSAKVITSSNGALTSYDTAEERDIGFSNFTPLTHEGKLIGGILLESKTTTESIDKNTRMKLYSKVFNSTALVLQNVLYTENLISITSTDQLTEVYNRRFIDMTLGEEVNIHRNLGMSLSVAIFDIDHFKKFNDTYGHPFGDLVLHGVAQYVKGQLGENEWVARYGGEEFLIFFGRSNHKQVLKRVDKIREGISQLQITDGETTASVTASFGVSNFPRVQTGNPADLIEIADQALYKSKRDGRNRVTDAEY